MIHLLVDAYNLLHQMERRQDLIPHERKISALSELEDRRRWMMEVLAEYRRVRDVEVTLVFDGSDIAGILPNRTKFGSLHILFSNENESADDRIAELCRKSPGGFYVISGDHDVMNAAETYDCPSIKSQEFVVRLGQALIEAQLDGDFAEEINADLPLYPKVSTKKKGAAKKKPKSERRKRQFLKNL